MIKKLSALLLAALCLAGMCSCSRRADITADGFIVPATGTEYVLCRMFSVYAVEKGGEYIKYGNEQVYEVEFESAKDFLCVEDSGELLVYRSASSGDISVTDFDPIAARIYDSSNTRWIASFFADDEYLEEDQRGINETQDSELCRTIARAVDEGEAVDLNYDNMAYTNRYFVRLLSQKYPGLYYVVVFFGDNDGRFYLRDRSINKTVICPRDVLSRMIGNPDYNPAAPATDM